MKTGISAIFNGVSRRDGRSRSASRSGRLPCSADSGLCRSPLAEAEFRPYIKAGLNCQYRHTAIRNNHSSKSINRRLVSLPCYPPDRPIRAPDRRKYAPASSRRKTVCKSLIWIGLSGERGKSQRRKTMIHPVSRLLQGWGKLRGDPLRGGR